MSEIRRFNQKVNKVENGCWEWTASLNWRGYGQFYFYGRNGGAHKFSYLYHTKTKEIPKGFSVHHLCRNRKCVNPEHLKCITIKENILLGESIIAKNAKKTHCLKGHEFTPDNTYIFKRRYYDGKISEYRCCKICGRERNRNKKYSDAYKSRMKRLAPKLRIYWREYSRKRNNVKEKNYRV